MDDIIEIMPDIEDNQINGNKEVTKSQGSSAIVAESPSYQALVDQVKQNNAWSAEQAQKQMDFQEKAWREQMEFNANQANINRDFQQDSANQAMNFSAEEAQKNRDWQEYLSNTAHQREVADLKAAGLNPILSATRGASTANGGVAASSQAAGSQASSVYNPQGAKGDTDESGTTAIASLLGKMLDNQVAREQMQNSAEIAQNQAEMYTAATRYAAELAAIASQYGSDKYYDASVNDISHLFGELVNQVIDNSGFSAASLGSEINMVAKNNTVKKVIGALSGKTITDYVFGGSLGSLVDNAATGIKNLFSNRDKVTITDNNNVNKGYKAGKSSYKK